MTESSTRTKPAVAAKIVVTGASLTSILAMTAAMGSAVRTADGVTTLPGSVPADEVGSVSTEIFPLPTAAELLIGSSPTPPFMAEVAPSSSIVKFTPTEPVEAGSTSSPSTTPVTALPPVPIIVQIPAPAPAPDASTNTSR